MYTMTIDGRPFFNPVDRALTLEAPILTLEANAIGTLTFTIYPDHPEYGSIRLLRSVFTVRRDGQIISQLRPLLSHMNFNGGVKWTCEELTGLLNDIIRRPTYELYSGTESAYIESLLTEYNNKRGTPIEVSILSIFTPWVLEHQFYLGAPRGSKAVYELYKWMVYFHYYEAPDYPPERYSLKQYNIYLAEAVMRFQRDNGLEEKYRFTVEDRDVLLEMIGEDGGETPGDTEQVEIPMTFSLGVNTYTDGTETAEHSSEDYIGFWDVLQRDLVNGHEKAYIVPVWGETECHLNYVSADTLPLSGQVVRYGENMADLFFDMDSEETFSVLIPLGGEHPLTKTMPPKDWAKLKVPAGPITISKVNNGMDYLVDNQALQTIGRKEHTQKWEDITDPQELFSKAVEWYKDNLLKMKESISLNAYELRYAGVNVEYLTFMTRVPVESDNHGLRNEYPLTRMEIPLDTPTALNIELGDDDDRITDIITESAASSIKTNKNFDGRLSILEDKIQGGASTNDVDSGQDS